MQVDRFFLSAIFLSAWLSAVPGLRAEPLLRLYDMSPVSATNPVVASVEDCGIAIPAGEFCAYMNIWMPPEKKRSVLTKTEKLQYLQQLLDEHLLLWDGYQKNLNHAPELAEQLESTLRLNLEQSLIHRELELKAPKTDQEKQKLIEALQDRILKAADLQVVPDAFEEFKAIINSPDGSEPVLDTLSDAQRHRPLVQYDGGTLSMADCLEEYYSLPAGNRPDIQEPAEFLKIAQPLLISPLMQAEGRKQGLESSAEVQANVQLNRNVLTKMAMLSRLASQGHAQREAPGWQDRAKQWYDTHKNRYAAQNGEILSYETNKRAVMDDYEQDIVSRIRAEELRSLRTNHTIIINDPVLENLSSLMNPRQYHENTDAHKNLAGPDS
jgi:hypothetical protein